MTSLVTDLLVNPVLRQARRFSLSRSSVPSHPPDPDTFPRISQTPETPAPPQQDEAIYEAEENPSPCHDSGDNAFSRRSSGGSAGPNPQTNAGDLEEILNQLDNTTMSSGPTTSAADYPSISAPQPPSSPFMQGRSPLPEDDGMGFLRKRILAIQARQLGHPQKAHLIHQLLIEGYKNSKSRTQPERPWTPSSPRSPEKRVSQNSGPLESFKFWQTASGDGAEEFNLTDRDLEPTFVPEKHPTHVTDHTPDVEPDDDKLLGCEHYRRNVKLQCSTCNRWYTCRFCHDEAEDHHLVRKETRNMLCMLCGTAQRASQTCISCEAMAARYYCDICKLWNDDPDKPCYHCNDCGICRIGHGIGKDFYHCKVIALLMNSARLVTNALIEMLCVHLYIDPIRS